MKTDSKYTSIIDEIKNMIKEQLAELPKHHQYLGYIAENYEFIIGDKRWNDIAEFDSMMLPSEADRKRAIETLGYTAYQKHLKPSYDRQEKEIIDRINYIKEQKIGWVFSILMKRSNQFGEDGLRLVKK